MDPVLVDPALVDPALVDPVLVDPVLVDPGLVDPGLVDPALVDPQKPSEIPQKHEGVRVRHHRKSEADGRKKKMLEGLGVTSLLDHADPQRTEEKDFPKGVRGSRPSDPGDKNAPKITLFLRFLVRLSILSVWYEA